MCEDSSFFLMNYSSWQWEADSMKNIRFGRLNLVDLAGSERLATLHKKVPVPSDALHFVCSKFN